MFIQKTFVTLFKIEAGSINIVNRFTITSHGNIVASFRQAVTSIITVSAEFLGFLKPKYKNFHVSKFSCHQWALLEESIARCSHESSDCLIKFINFVTLWQKLLKWFLIQHRWLNLRSKWLTGQTIKCIHHFICVLFAIETVCHNLSLSLTSTSEKIIYRLSAAHAK